MTKKILWVATLALLSACGGSSEVTNQVGASIDPDSISVKVFEPLVAGDCTNLTASHQNVTVSLATGDDANSTAGLAKEGGGGPGKSAWFSSGVCANYIVQVSGHVIGIADSVLVQLAGDEVSVVVERDGTFNVKYSANLLDLGSLKITPIDSTGILATETIFLSFN